MKRSLSDSSNCSDDYTVTNSSSTSLASTSSGSHAVSQRNSTNTPKTTDSPNTTIAMTSPIASESDSAIESSAPSVGRFGSTTSVTDLDLDSTVWHSEADDSGLGKIPPTWAAATAAKTADWNRGHPVVVVRDAVKSYGSRASRREVLSHLSMTIREGSIYGLLGASGCGKTTMLSAIVGLKTVDTGMVSVFGGIPGDRSIGIPGKRIGYMPQELALYGEFTIMESLQYFGRIYGMDKASVKKQSAFLLDFLDLPKKNRMVRTLSGGQQRRVSFAVALLHNPELLILDEPTVGVDPMLRQNIWSYLLRLSSEQKKTILITTHYIEEARQANYVGLMRHGKLLAEDSPTQLLTIYGLNTLEEVFLKLCVKEESKNKFKKLSEQEDESEQDDGVFSKLQNLNASIRARSGQKRPHVNGLVYPGLTASTNDHSIQAISYCAKNPSQKLHPDQAKAIRMQHGNNCKVDLNMEAHSIVSTATNGEVVGAAASSSTVNEDIVPVKRKSRFACNMPNPGTMWALVMKNFIKMWRNMMGIMFVFLLPAVEVFFFCIAIGQDPTKLPLGFVNNEMSNFSSMANCSFNASCEFTNLSCRFLKHMEDNDTVTTRYFENESLALEASKQGEIWGYVSIHKNFSTALLARLWQSLEIDSETREQSSIQIHLDMSNQQVGYTLQRFISDTFQDFLKGLLRECSIAEDIADPPIKFNAPIYGPERPNFTEFMAPGIIIIIIFFLAVGLTGEAFIAEKQDGLLDRSWVAGVLPSEIMFSHIATQFLVLLGQTAITLIFILLVFGIPCTGPVGWLIVLTILQGFAGMCFGFLLSTLFSEQTTAMQCAIGSFYPMLLLSGIIWPIEGMPSILQKISWYLPCTAACQAMRDIMARGWTITRPSVYMGIVSSSIWIAVFIIASWLAMRILR